MKRAYYFDYLRMVAILGVIAIHVAAAYVVMYMKIPMIQWEASVIFNGLVRWCVPIFFMVSGALLLGRKEEPLSQFFKRRANRILVPFIIWSIGYYIWRQYFWYDGNFDVRQFIHLFATNGIYYHLWYLYALIGIYLVVPMLNVFVNYAKLSLVAYICAVWYIVYCVFRYFNYEMANVVPDFFVLSNYAGMVLIGYYLSRVEIPKKWRYSLYAGGLFGLFMTVQQTFALTNEQGAFTSYPLQYESPFVMLSAMALFVFFRYYIGRKQAQSEQFKPNRIVMLISETSFGIYLSHVMILDIVRTYFHNDTDIFINPIIGLPMQLTIVLLSSFIFTWMIRKTTFLKKIF